MAFYFSYMGNKRKELQFLSKYIDLTKYDNIIEPFGGTCAFSRHCFSIDQTKNYIISDNDEYLINFCNNFHKKSDEKIEQSLNKMNEIFNKDDYITFMKGIDKTWYNIRPGLYSEKNQNIKN